MKKLTQFTALLSLVAASVITVGCGSATDAQGEVQSPTASAPVGSAQAPLAGREGQEHHGGGRMFRRFDKDGDGKVALADLPEQAREFMKAADTNGDGYLTKDEVKAAREAHHAKMQAMMDTDGDGKVSDEERKAARQKFEEEWQKKVDTNHDGTVSDEERAAARAKFGGGRGGHGHWKETADSNH